MHDTVLYVSKSNVASRGPAWSSLLLKTRGAYPDWRFLPPLFLLTGHALDVEVLLAFFTCDMIFREISQPLKIHSLILASEALMTCTTFLMSILFRVLRYSSEIMYYLLHCIIVSSVILNGNFFFALEALVVLKFVSPLCDAFFTICIFLTIRMSISSLYRPLKAY